MRPTTTRLVVAAFLVAALSPPSAMAQVIRNNGTPDNQSGLDITINQWKAANDFTIGKKQQAVLNSFDFWVLQQNQTAAITSSFFWQILSDDAGQPGTSVIASGNVVNATGVATSYFCCGTSAFLYAYLFSASLGDATIGSGVYWLAIGGYTTASDNGVQYWATSAQAGNQMHLKQGETAWENVPSEGAFVLYGTTSSPPTSTVPEPGTLALMASGVVGLAGLRIRRRRTS